MTSNYLKNLDMAFTPNNNCIHMCNPSETLPDNLVFYTSGHTNCFSCSVTVTIQLCKSDVRPTMEHMHPQYGTAFKGGGCFVQSKFWSTMGKFWSTVGIHVYSISAAFTDTTLTHAAFKTSSPGPAAQDFGHFLFSAIHIGSCRHCSIIDDILQPRERQIC